MNLLANSGLQGGKGGGNRIFGHRRIFQSARWELRG
jgi:hypothetical protein